MANLQVKNLPVQLNQRLHRYAKEQNRTIREVVLEAVQRELDRRSFVERLRRRPASRLRTSAAELLDQERRTRGLEP